MQNPIEHKNDPADDIDVAFSEVALELAKKRAEEDLIKQAQVLTKEGLIEHYQKEIEKEFASLRKQQQRGAAKIVEMLGELVKENPDMFTEEIVKGIDRIADLSERIAETEFAEQIYRDVSLQEIAKVDDTVMNTLYQGAKRLYEKNLFDDAAAAFTFLIGLNAQNTLFWRGLASAEFNRKEYKKALDAFATLCELNPNDPASHLLCSHCYEELGQLEQAKDELNLALSAIEANHSFDGWMEGMKQEKERLDRRQ